ncbi:flagellar hook-associated protein FlgL [Spartinivicinus ruber]|uniref:flagellar hook-associated protein FlgL n=1 Tax=Spartinivicinus ruber TaxID=2683272 RepID=UPI0013D52FFE|nr:flagellar hook-associated protein FlgL [Spartinivicinus ruber]
MRISTLDIFRLGLNQIQKNNAELLNTQQQVATGRRVVTPGDDPVASTKIVAIQQDQAIAAQFRRNLDAAENSLKIEEAALQGIKNVYQRVRELTVRAGNGSLSLSDKAAIADEIEVRLDELKDLFNRKNADGVFIFAGFQASQSPFIDKAGGGFEYLGDEGQRFLQIAASASVAINDSGKDLFVDVPSNQKTFLTSANPNNTANPLATITVGQIVDQDDLDAFYPDDLIITFNPETAVVPNGANYTVKTKEGGLTLASNIPFQAGESISHNGMAVVIEGTPNAGDTFFIDTSDKQDVLTTVKRLQDGLDNAQNDGPGRTVLQKLLDDTLVNMDNAISSLLEVQSELGGRLNIIDSTRAQNEDFNIVSEEFLAEILYVDQAEAISRLSLQNFLLQAAQQSFTTISNLSLFNNL